MIEIRCDKCGRKISVNVKTVSAKTLEKCGFEAISIDGKTVNHLCFKCLESLEEWVGTPDLRV